MQVLNEMKVLDRMKRYSLSAVLAISAYMAVLLLEGPWLVIAIWPDGLDTTSSQTFHYAVLQFSTIGERIAIAVLIMYVGVSLLGRLDKPVFKTIPFLLLLGVLAGEFIFFLYAVGTALN